MSVVAERLATVSLGTPGTHENLTLHPLLAEGPESGGYLLLDEALAAGCARATEVSERGSVPELSFANDCDRPVLLLDGEELTGAKQNRILNLSVLAPAGETIVIPVSCVEAGRWHLASPELASARRAHYASGRARKAVHVTQSLRTTGLRRSNQSAVWADIAGKAERLDAHSATEAAEALYETHRERLRRYMDAFAPVAGQCGAVFTIGGRVAGLDLFDSPATLAALLPKLVESYALDAIDESLSEDGASDVRGFVEGARRADVQAFPAVGLGEDIRLRGAGMAGGALAHQGRVVHLCLFPVPTADDPIRRSPLARASTRRWHR